MTKLFILILMLIYNAALADIVISTASVDESYSDNVRVSGKFLVGIQLMANDNLKSLHVFFPENSKGMLCVKLSSIDGKYKAMLKHTITKPVSGFIKIKFDSKYKKVIDNYADYEVAILASLKGACGKNVISKQLVSGWGGNATGNLVILIRSSARKDVAYIPSEENFKKMSKCIKIRNSYNVSYDKICTFKEINLSDIEKVEIVRKNLQPIKPELIILN